LGVSLGFWKGFVGVCWGLFLFFWVGVLGFMRVLDVVGCLDFRGSYWVLLYGLAGLFICILHVYLFYYLSKKKKKKDIDISMPFGLLYLLM
jgi:hypothetical protein